MRIGSGENAEGGAEGDFSDVKVFSTVIAMEGEPSKGARGKGGMFGCCQELNGEV